MSEQEVLTALNGNDIIFNYYFLSYLLTLLHSPGLLLNKKLIWHDLIDLKIMINEGYRSAQHEGSTDYDIKFCSRHAIIGKSFNPNIMSEDSSPYSDKELTATDGDLTHEGSQFIQTLIT